jgi:hypothetical protein
VVRESRRRITVVLATTGLIALALISPISAGARNAVLNHAPIATADTATAAEDAGPTSIDVLANDSDRDAGQVLTISAVTDPSAGIAVVVQGGTTIDYTPVPNANGVDIFSYTVSDGAGKSATATVTVNITPVNDPPNAGDDSLALLSNTPANLAVLANDGDVDGDVLSVASVTVPASGAAVIEPDGSITYTPAPEYSGPDAFEYTISDGAGGTAWGHVTVDVSAIDHSPVAIDDSVAASEDSVVSVPVLANDFDPDVETLTTVAITEQPSHGSAAIAIDGTILYTPTSGYNGPDAFSYLVADPAGLTDEGDVLVTVSSDVDEPVGDRLDHGR